MYAKLSDYLKQSPLYEKHNLSYEAINEIYKKSLSIPNFAKNLMVHLFNKAELLECHNVRGCDSLKRVVGGRLDETRVETIRLLIEENAGDHFDQKLWPTCVTWMNIELSRIKKLRRVNNQTEHEWIHMTPIK